ncbi:MAG: glycosyltransferase family 2 protein [Alphaproteobacteria bacterium]
MPSSVAIIIPVYNVVQYLEQAVGSAAGQDHTPLEVIVVDDGSGKEASGEIARICTQFPGVTLLAQKNKGAAAARDAGLAHSTADHVLFLDADDVLQPHAASTLSSALDTHPDYVASYARYQKVDAQGTPIGAAKPPLERQVSGRQMLCKLLELKPPFVIGSICVRRSALQALKVPNHGLTYGEDWALWCHLALSGNIAPASDKVAVQYREHVASASTAYAKDPMPVFEAFDRIFKDPVFSNALGKDKLLQLEQECINNTHMRLARYYAAHNDKEKSQRHFDAMTLPPAEFYKKR